MENDDIQPIFKDEDKQMEDEKVLTENSEIQIKDNTISSSNHTDILSTPENTIEKEYILNEKNDFNVSNTYYNSNINSLTLEYFSNLGAYNKYLNKSKIEKTITNSDKKFYKKRILDSTKKMLKGEFESEPLKEIFNKYIFSLINHFKIIDRNEILQKQFNNLSGSVTETEFHIDFSNNKINSDISNNLNNNENSIDISDISSCNPDELLFKKNDYKILTMDNFVNKKQKQREKIHLPLKKNINLREPELKMKGIHKKEKKENIDNV